MKKTKKQKMVNIKCTENQLLIIERCLEIVSRIGAGQLSHIEEAISLCQDKALEVSVTDDVILIMKARLAELQDEALCNDKFAWFRLGSVIEDILKPLLFPELHRNASYGIGMKKIPNGQIMYEIYKKIQNWRTRNLPENEGGVLRHEPLKYSDEPLIEISETK